MESERSSTRRIKKKLPDQENIKPKIIKKKSSKFIHCADCGFRSKRAFNVERHYDRIHGPAKRKLNCCGKKYLTKGQYYQHCADSHPESRKRSTVSAKKYKIGKTAVEVNKSEIEKITHGKYYLRNIMQQQQDVKIKKPKKEDFNYYIDENLPLINYVKKENEDFFIKKEEIFKQECNNNDHCFVNNNDIKNDFHPIQIIFKGDLNSPLHATKMLEFWKDIDFDDLSKIV